MKEVHMHFRQFGKNGWRVSEIGLGTWQLGGDWGTVADNEARDILKAAVDSGVTFFDTADVYGGGRSEAILGTFFKDISDEHFIATKLGRFEGFPDDYSPELFGRCVENSLRRLRQDTIDLVQLHCIPQKWLENGEVFDWLRELKSEGKIQAFGASVETVEEALICLKQEDIASLQVIFNIFRQTPADDLFKEATAHQTALIIRLPLASGLLSGKFTSETRFAENDHRFYNRNGEVFNPGETFSGLEFNYALNCVDAIRSEVPQGMTMAQFALRWILDHPEVSVVIPGASKVAQVQGNVMASEVPPLDDDVHKMLREFYNGFIDGRIRGRC
jgi:aryl-alcohol dehydrogenase-like predicted oxidoreductase